MVQGRRAKDRVTTVVRARTERLSEFARRYRAELPLEPANEVLRKLPNVRNVRQLVLLTATRDVQYSRATVLRNVIVRASDS
jgi:uncharacterized protein YeaO (DUF488 family)